MKLLQEISVAVFFLTAGAVLSYVGSTTAHLQDTNVAFQLCNERVIDAEIRQGEAAAKGRGLGSKD
ncbi:MAG: hypothetical protein V3S69_00030 [Dehalococcoidales bacterium]